MLIAELERAMLRGEGDAGREPVLQELRHVIRGGGHRAPRIGDAARWFFMPVEPFLIDGAADHKRLSRLARVSLDPIWQWIGRDLLPPEAKVLCADIDRALGVQDRPKADQLVRALHDRAVPRMMEAVAALDANQKARRRLAVKVGTPRAIDTSSC